MQRLPTRQHLSFVVKETEAYQPQISMARKLAFHINVHKIGKLIQFSLGNPENSMLNNNNS